MKTKFKEYITPTEEERKAMWENAVIVFDTNILLNLYRYTKETRDDLLKAMRNHQDKIWMPYQVGYEYFESRLNIIDKMTKANDVLKKALSGLKKTIEKTFQDNYSHHPLIKHDEFFKVYDDAINSINKKLDEWMKAMPSYKKEDTILTQLLSLYEGKTGDDYPEDKLNEIYKEGEKRAADAIPPGYKDVKTKKDEGSRHQYGDLIIWKQMIDYSNDNNKNIVFVTEDQKEDWWSIQNGVIISPRVELLREFRKQANHDILFYRQNSFLESIKAEVRKETTAEVNNISEADKRFADSLISDIRKHIEEKFVAYPVGSAMQGADYAHLISEPIQNVFDKYSVKPETIGYTPIALLAERDVAIPVKPTITELMNKMGIGETTNSQLADWRDVLKK